MLSFDLFPQRLMQLVIFVIVGLMLTACQFQPLHGGGSVSSASGGLSAVGVASVDTRVGQQVRNHLLFLLNGGGVAAENTHEARIRVSANNRRCLLYTSDAADD